MARCLIDMTTKKPNGNKSHQNQIRMDDELQARVHKYRLKFEKETGLKVSFSSAVRLLVEKGLEA